MAGAVIQDTLEAYRGAEETNYESGRYYHTNTHISDCLRKLAPYQERSDFLQLWKALLWHDVVYDTHQPDNEEQSGLLAQEYEQKLRLDDGPAVARLIVATKDHRPDEEDEALVCAIDMSILAEPPEVYDAYAAAVRKEYDWVPLEQFITGRQRILEGFGQVFFHPDFIHLEEKAQDNMQRELAVLSQ